MDRDLIVGDIRRMECKIVILDDLSGTVAKASHALGRAGYSLIHAYSMDDVLKVVGIGDCCMFIIAWSEFDFDGLNSLKKFKDSFGEDVLVVVCTTRKLEFEIVTAFNTGADDVFRMEYGGFELLARVNALLKLSGFQNVMRHSEKERAGSMPLLYSEETGDRFTKQEADLFKLFQLNLNNCLTNKEIAKNIWMNESLNSKVVTVAVTRFRKKLYKIYPDRYQLMNIHNVGYRLIQLNILSDDLVT